MKIYWLGPTMGKTYACSNIDNNTKYIDFDVIFKPAIKALAKELGMDEKELKTSQPKEFVEMFLRFIKEYRDSPYDGVLLVSNAIGLKHRELFDVLMMPTLDAFIERSTPRDSSSLSDSFNWYHTLMYEYNASKYCVLENRYVSELIEKGII